MATLHGGLSGLLTALEGRAEGDTVFAVFFFRIELINFIFTPQASAGSESEFVSAIVGGIPPAVVSRGVYTEESLRERFTRVETVARRVGALGEDGGSLIK